MERNAEVDEYMAETPEKFKGLMKELRDRIFEYFPEGEEVFAYRIPVYKYRGKPLFSIAAFRDHYSIITQDKNIVKKIPELSDYKISGTTIRFNAEKPITDELLNKIISVRTKAREERLR